MKLLKSDILLILIVVLTYGCKQHTVSGNYTEQIPEYAKLFAVSDFGTYKELLIINPWNSSGNLGKFALIPEDVDIPSGISSDAVILRTPLKNLACNVSTHVGMLDKIGALDNIKAVAEPQYIYIEKIGQLLEEGSVISYGEASSPDVERLILSNPDAILLSPFENQGYGNLEKLDIPIIALCEYMEYHPLGRAEWIKVLGMLTGKEAESDSIFNLIVKKYQKVREIASSVSEKPTIMSELKSGHIWYMPGGESYMGTFFKDAGTEYIWAGTEETGSLSIPSETILGKAEDADYWLIKYSDEDSIFDYRHLSLMSEEYTLFKAFRDRHVIFCNLSKSNYFDKGIIEPDVILSDLVNLVHPGLIENHTQVYFDWLKE